MWCSHFATEVNVITPKSRLRPSARGIGEDWLVQDRARRSEVHKWKCQKNLLILTSVCLLKNLRLSLSSLNRITVKSINCVRHHSNSKTKHKTNHRSAHDACPVRAAARVVRNILKRERIKDCEIRGGAGVAPRCGGGAGVNTYLAGKVKLKQPSSINWEPQTW